MPRGQMGSIRELRWLGRYEGIVRTVVTSKVYVIYRSTHIQNITESCVAGKAYSPLDHKFETPDLVQTISCYRMTLQGTGTSQVSI